jgi:DNA mismatch endonuclease (patch repair protein)
VNDRFTKSKRTEFMSLIRGEGNRSTELAMIQLFRTQRITGWRRHLAVRGKRDFVFPKLRVAVFLDGASRMDAPSTPAGPNVDYRNYRASLELAS